MGPLIFLVFLFAPIEMAYINGYDEAFNFQCPSGRTIKSIKSVHHNFFEDRRWEISCQSTSSLYAGRCKWTFPVNNFDEPLLFQCPGNGIIAGIYSYHDNHYEDRRFKFYCCDLATGRKLIQCAFGPYVNKFDEKMEFTVPSGRVLGGAFSYHRDKEEDRRWRFEVCRVD